MTSTIPGNRLVSLDAYRGLTMFLLIAESAFVYESLTHIFGEQALDVTNALFSLAIMCYLSYFLYRKKIFFRV